MKKSCTLCTHCPSDFEICPDRAEVPRESLSARPVRSPRLSALGAGSGHDTGQVLLNRFPEQWLAHHRTRTSCAIFPSSSKPVSPRPWSTVHLSTTASRGLATPASLVGAHSPFRQVTRYSETQPGGGDFDSIGGSFNVAPRDRDLVVKIPPLTPEVFQGGGPGPTRGPACGPVLACMRDARPAVALSA